VAPLQAGELATFLRSLRLNPCKSVVTILLLRLFEILSSSAGPIGNHYFNFMRRSIQTSFVLCITAVPLFVSPLQSLAASPVTVFDSFGPGDTYLTTVGWGVTGASTSGAYRGQAEWFVPGASGNLSTITLAMFRQGGSGRANFFMAQDNGSGIPGTVLESYLNILSPNGLLTLSSSSQPLLQAGVTYWLCAEPADSTAVNGWFENNQSYTPGFAFERSQWGWTAFTDPAHSPPSGVFRVNVTPVPEPSTLGLAALCFCLVKFPRAITRRRQAAGLMT